MDKTSRKLLTQVIPLALLAIVCLAGVVSTVYLTDHVSLALACAVMGITVSYSKSFQLGGTSASSQVTRTGDGLSVYSDISLSAGKAVTGWTKTDANTASCTLAAGHGQTNGKYDVYWSVAGVSYVRYGLDGTISTNTLSLDGGAGTDFPATSTTGVVVCKQTTVSTNIDGDNTKIFIVNAVTSDRTLRNPVHLDFWDSGSATVGEFLVKTNDVYSRDIDGGETNTITGNVITSCKVSNGGTADVTLTIGALVDSTP